MTYPLQASAQRYHALKAALLEAMPELAEDPDCLLDTLEGQSDVHEQLGILLRSAKDDETFVVGLKLRIAQYKDRLAALEMRAQKKRQIALHFMGDLDIKTLKLPDMTVSRHPVGPSVIIVQEDLIADEYMRIRREPNKTMIKRALLEGKDVDGCVLSNASETLFIKI